jgi:undecaprenyl diphosphate synthase
MAEAAEMTAGNKDLNLVFAFNYGSRREIVEAVRALAARAVAGTMETTDIDEAAITGALYIPGMPDVDLIIRSSGEHRLSNFLLWQSAYAEFHFPGILWPDFDRNGLLEAVLDYQRRDRRFGGAEDQVPD